MNSTFKVVFNKARGALMVVNEVTSSVQGKGTKTVVAAAVAAMIAGVSGSAMATETDTEIKATDTALKATFTKAEKQTDVASSLIGTSGDKLALKNVTNKDMYAAGSLDLTASSKDNVVTLKNGSVSNFSGKVTSADHFGAVVTATTGTLKIDNVTFENNKFDEVKTGEQKHNGARGIIRAAGANLEVAKSTFAGNEAVLGGAINVWSNGENTVKITDSTFTGNATKSHGGAVYITGSKVKTTIADSTFSKNTSGKQGGALQLAGAGETTITNTTFSENAAGTFGGAINATNTQIVAKNVNFEGNKAVGDDGHGGALFLNGNTASYTQAGGKFVGNSAKKNGGAIRVQDGADLALTNVVFDGNTAANGGAVDTFNAGDVKFTDTTFTNNQAGGWGGALRINGGNVTIAVTEGKSLVYEGNKAGTNAEEAAVKKYEKQGDFMYLSNASDKATFALAGDLTIKDSIVSNHGTIEKTGKGTLTTADMTGFVGKLDVKEGKMVIEGGIAEYDIAAQIGVNNGSNDAVALDATTVTVGQQDSKAELAMGAVQANHAINFVVNKGSTLTMQSLAVGTKEYAQRTEAKADPAKATYVGAVNIKGDATVTEGITVAAGTADQAAALTQTSGNLTAKSLTVAAAVKGEKDAVTAQAGTFTQEAGKLTVDTLTNGGTMTVKDTVVTKADSVNTGAINSYDSKKGSLTIAGGTFTNDGTMTFDKITVEDGATLKTGVNLNGEASFVVFKELELQKGSTLNINALNAKSQVDGKEVEKADILKFTEGTVNLYGGALQVAGEAFTGKVELAQGTTTNINGDYTFEQVNNAGTTTVGGTLTVTDSFTAGTFKVDNNGTLVLTTKAAGLKIAEGTATTNSNLTNNGTITFTDAAGEFADLDKVAAVKNAIARSGNGLIVFGDKVTIKAEEVNKVLKDGKVKASDVANLAGVELEQFKDATVTGVDAALSGSFGKVELAAGQTALTVESGLKLNGTGDLVTVKKDKTVTLQGVNIGEYGKLTTTGAGAVVGAIAGNGGKFGALNVAAGDLTVKGAAALQNLTVAADSALVMGKAAETATAVGDLEVKGSALVLGTLTAGNVTLKDADVLGTLTADKLAATGTVCVGSDEDDVAGKLVVNELVSGTVFADPAWKDGHILSLNDASQVAVGTAAAGSTVVAGQGSLVALGTTDLDVAVKTVAAAGHAVLGTNEGQMKSAIYVDGGKTYDEATDTTSYKTIAGNVIASGWSTAEFEDAANKTGVQVLENNLMVVDMNTIDKTGAHAVFANAVTNNGTIYLADAEFGDKVMFSEAGYTQGTIGAITFNGDRLMSAAFKDKVHTIAFDDAKVASYEGLETLPLVTAMYEGKAQNGASTSAKFNNWLMSSGNGLDREEVIAIGNDAAKLGATSAVASVTMDAISAFNDSVAARTNVLAQRAEGVTVWADVMGGHYEAKELMDGQGYKSDVYGGVLGVDSVVDGYTLGAAFTVATADTDSTNTLAVSSTDSDFVGFSFYGAKAFGQFNLAADLGYMKGSNDVSVNAYNIGDFSADTDAFTLGLRGDVLVDAGSFKVVPHAGLRFTHLTTDDFESAYTTKIDSMNIFQMPVGVTVTGNVEAAGWNVAPLLDLSVVPAFGDTDADMTLGINGVAATSALSTQVIDSNLFQMKLGVSAQKDAFTFGLNYKLGAGSDNRVNNTFNATVGYAF
ncbi:autotransporter domain-containing protein [uncultured Sutterella sp.]|uniref:autotransporter domain-containing protein n=1 Tax=uncultured Sutterella sp. TaxID=286133 RepID=UPI00266F46E3|nr:autotransporter domain-containing protein [uncultured Sutterella sp.]